MRLIAAIFLVLVMLWGVPMLWQRAMVAEVNRIAETNAGMPEVGGPMTNFTEVGNIQNAINPQLEINTEEYEALAVQSQADQAMRQARQAQDQAWDATH